MGSRPALPSPPLVKGDKGGFGQTSSVLTGTPAGPYSCAANISQHVRQPASGASGYSAEIPPTPPLRKGEKVSGASLIQSVQGPSGRVGECFGGRTEASVFMCRSVV